MLKLKCSKCKEVKHETEFWLRSMSSNKRQYYCIPCKKAIFSLPLTDDNLHEMANMYRPKSSNNH